MEVAPFAGARVWNSLPSDLKQCKSLQLFISNIKKWISKNSIANLVKITSNESGTCKLDLEVPRECESLKQQL